MPNQAPAYAYKAEWNWVSTVNYTAKADKSIDMDTIAVNAKGSGYVVDEVLTIQSSGTKDCHYHKGDCTLRGRDSQH